MEIVVACGFGVETATKLELKKLNIDARCINGRFTFSGSAETVVKCNLCLRTADRVYIKLAEFEADSFDALFDGVYACDWLALIPRYAQIIVDAKSKDSKLFALSAVQSIAKKAIVKKMQNKYSTLSETADAVRVEIGILSDKVTVLVDTSGDGLHKRGYRDMVYEAPIRETLAAAMLIYSGWDRERALFDAFCGSGTIPIEAAMIAKNIAPGLFRNFAFENLLVFDKNIAQRVKTELEGAIDNGFKPRITGFDINKRAIGLCVRHASRAKLADCIHFETADMRTFSSRFKYGVIVTNPPYGERLSDAEELITLCRDFRQMYRSLPDWSACVISAYEGFERYFGTADKTRKTFNAALPCRIFSYFQKAGK